MKKEKSCGAIIFSLKENKEQILLIKHINGGHWSFPKGHVEDGETETETALREIEEETNLKVSLDTRFREITTYSPEKNVIKDVVYFFAVSDSRETAMQKEEISDIKWVDISDAENIVSYKNDKKLLQKAINFYFEHKKEINYDCNNN